MKKLVSIVFSLLILGIIYWQIDAQNLLAIFKDCNLAWMIISLSMFIPLTMLSACRLQWLMPQGRGLSFAEANRLILAASVLNMILPSKMGDIAKSYFMAERGQMKGSLSLSLVVFEKACDMLSLLLWCMVALYFYPHKNALFWGTTVIITLGFFAGLFILGSRSVAKWFFTCSKIFLPGKIRLKLERLEGSWTEMQAYVWGNPWRFLVITTGSIFIWFLHLLQIWLFILALNAWAPFFSNLALSPLAILAGLVPLTFAGIGTRDVALISLYQPYFDAPTAAALGVLCTSRYILPAILGLPFLHTYLKQSVFQRDNQPELTSRLSPHST